MSEARILQKSCSPLYYALSVHRCVDLTGSTWKLYAKLPTHAKAEPYELEFLTDGVLYTFNPLDATRDDDGWTLEGDGMTLSFNNGYAVYTGYFRNAHTIDGIATNIKGVSWPFRLVRQSVLDPESGHRP